MIVTSEGAVTPGTGTMKETRDLLDSSSLGDTQGLGMWDFFFLLKIIALKFCVDF